MLLELLVLLLVRGQEILLLLLQVEMNVILLLLQRHLVECRYIVIHCY